jgi:hypothetical protein
MSIKEGMFYSCFIRFKYFLRNLISEMDSPFVTMHQDDLVVFGPMLQTLLNIEYFCPIFFSQINTIFF